jgi:CHAD domain-containing protein
LPFTNKVIKYLQPEKFKVLQVEMYDWSKDPMEHIETYWPHLILHVIPDEIACQAFPLTLMGAARSSFGSLPPMPVVSFDDLGRLFQT